MDDRRNALATTATAGIEAQFRMWRQRASCWLKPASRATVIRVDGREEIGVEPAGWTVICCPSETDKAEIAGLLAEMTAARQPATYDDRVKALAALSVWVKERDPLDESQAKLRMAMWAQRCGEFPGAIVLDELDKWGRTERWWPAWEEIETRIRARMKREDELRAALERLMTPPREQKPEPDARHIPPRRQPPSEEQATKVREMVAACQRDLVKAARMP